jgi:hypothetical protein
MRVDPRISVVAGTVPRGRPPGYPPAAPQLPPASWTTLRDECVPVVARTRRLARGFACTYSSVVSFVGSSEVRTTCWYGVDSNAALIEGGRRRGCSRRIYLGRLLEKKNSYLFNSLHHITLNTSKDIGSK